MKEGNKQIKDYQENISYKRYLSIKEDVLKNAVINAGSNSVWYRYNYLLPMHMHKLILEFDILTKEKPPNHKLFAIKIPKYE